MPGLIWFLYLWYVFIESHLRGRHPQMDKYSKETPTRKLKAIYCKSLTRKEKDQKNIYTYIYLFDFFMCG